MTDLSKFKTKAPPPFEVETLDTGIPAKKRPNPPHFGCPLEWARRVRLVVRTKDQMLVAIWLHRQLSIPQRTPQPVSRA